MHVEMQDVDSCDYACISANDLVAFERTLENKQNRILADPFIMSYVAPLRRRMREQVFSILSEDT